LPQAKPPYPNRIQAGAATPTGIRNGHGGRGHSRRGTGAPPPPAARRPPLRGLVQARGVGGGARVVRGRGGRDGNQGGDDDLLRPGHREAGAGDGRRVPGGERGDAGEDGGHGRVRRRAGRVPRRARGQAHAPGAGPPGQGRRAAAAAPAGVQAHRRRRVRARPRARLRRALQGGRPRRRIRQLHRQGVPRYSNLTPPIAMPWKTTVTHISWRMKLATLMCILQFLVLQPHCHGFVCPPGHQATSTIMS
jgi:hypothetical protein